MNEATDYEQERLRNIRENEALMRELGVLHGSSALGAPRRQAAAAAASSTSSPARRTTRSKAASTLAKKKDAKPTRVMPTRSSARLAGHEATSETLKRKYEQEAEQAHQEAERAKRARHGQHDLATMTGGDLEEQQIRALEKTLAGLASNMAKAAELVEIGGKKREREQKKSAAITELKEVLDRMELRSAAKVTQKRVYSMAFHPTMDKDLVFVGDKEGAIGIWDAAALQEAVPAPTKREYGEDEVDVDEDGEAPPEGKAWSLQVHGKSPVTSLKLDPVSGDSLYSSSYDATIRRLDLTTQTSDEVWEGEETVLLSVFDILAPTMHASAFSATPNPALDERSIWIGDHRGGLVHIDVRQAPRRRSSGNATSRRWQVCEKKIGALSVNPAAPHCIATASLDQHVRLFDVRALATIVETNEAPYNYKNVNEELLSQVHVEAQLASSKARQACTSVDFSPRGDQLVGVSYDDVVKVWDVEPRWLHSRYVTIPTTSSSTTTIGKDEAPKRVTRSATSTPIKKEPTPLTGLLNWLTRKPPTPPKSSSDIASPRPLVGASDDRLEDLLSSPKVIAHNNQTGKWLTMFRARWHGNAALEPHFSIGSMARRAEIYDGNGNLLKSLFHPDIVTAVPAVTAMHPIRAGKLATGNASGRCTFWDAESVTLV